MKYQYTVFLPSNPNEQWKRRPMLQIEIFGKKGSQKFNALVDSGADYSLFNIQVAELLGQEGFFDQFRIKFEKDHNIFEVTPVKK